MEQNQNYAVIFVHRIDRVQAFYFTAKTNCKLGQICSGLNCKQYQYLTYFSFYNWEIAMKS